MNIDIICIGKLKEKYWQEACLEYLKRLSRFCRINIVELPESKTDDIDEESKNILSHIKEKAFVIALDIKGKRLGSLEFALKIKELSVNGKSDITFVIGGSNGYNEQVRKRADFSLSFSDLTFPHQLARVILLEQIYRCFKINAGEKYHK